MLCVLVLYVQCVIIYVVCTGIICTVFCTGTICTACYSLWCLYRYYMYSVLYSMVCIPVLYTHCVIIYAVCTGTMCTVCFSCWEWYCYIMIPLHSVVNNPSAACVHMFSVKWPQLHKSQQCELHRSDVRSTSISEQQSITHDLEV